MKPPKAGHRGGEMRILCTHRNYETKKIMDFVFNICLDCGHQWKFGNDPMFIVVDIPDTEEEE